MSKIGTKSCNLDELNRIIEDCFTNPIAILERYYCMDNEMPDFFNYLSKLKGNVSEWDKGRVFDNNSEVRWEKDKIGFHLGWIKDGGNIPDGWNEEMLKSIDSHEILLWGTQISGKKEWYEKQIPRIFEYPIRDIGNMAYVVINEYIHKDGSKFYRLREVKAK
jgi:hypothetical protein